MANLYEYFNLFSMDHEKYGRVAIDGECFIFISTKIPRNTNRLTDIFIYIKEYYKMMCSKTEFFLNVLYRKPVVDVPRYTMETCTSELSLILLENNFCYLKPVCKLWRDQ